MSAGSRYHVMFEDPASGEELGLILSERGGTLGRAAQLANPYAAKVGQGTTQLSDLQDLSVYETTDWRGGRGQEIREEADRFFDSRGMESRIKGQLTLGPLSRTSDVGDNPYYAPDDVVGLEVRHSSIELGSAITHVGTIEIGSDTDAYAIAFEAPTGLRDVSQISVVLIHLASSSQVKLSLCSDNSGEPGTVLVSQTTNLSYAPGYASWLTFSWTAQTVSPGTTYWVKIEELSGTSIGVRYSIDYDIEGSAHYDDSAWSDYYPPRAAFFRIYGSEVERSMSFTTPAGGLTCSSVTLKLRKLGNIGSYYTVHLRDDDSGPDSSLRSTSLSNADVDTVFGEVEVEWSSDINLSGSTTYHITLEVSGTIPRAVLVEWAAEDGTSYAGGSAHYQVGGGGWTADSEHDLFFRVNNAPRFSDAITVDPVRFNGAWYCASGDTVYVWDSANAEWDSSDEQSGEDVTDMITWGDYLWVARGANNMRRMNTSDTWADAPGPVEAQLLEEHAGYLYRTDPANQEDVYYTGDGSTWSSAIEVGPGDWGINALAAFGDELAMANDVGVYFQSVDWAYPVLEYKSLEDSDNGRGMVTWVRTGELYIPIGYGLYKWNGQSMVAVGPDLDAGLPAARAGKIASMVGTVNWLFAAIDAGANGTSSILAYNGHGWHEIVRAHQSGSRIRAIGYETISSPPRLWWGEGRAMRYVELPDYTDNPYQYSGIAFAPDGEITGSWVGTELLQVTKDWRAVVIHAEGCDSDQTIRIYYEIDRSGQWTLLGTIDDGRPIHTLPFPSSIFSSLTVGSGSTSATIELKSGSTTSDIATGDWVRINGEIRQVASVTDSDTFVLETPLSGAPVEDNTVYPAAPAGTELRLKVELSTEDSTSSPKLLAVAVYCQANVLDRWTITLDVEIGDGTKCLDGSRYPLDSEALIDELEDWIARPTAFVLHDLHGQTRMVKVANASELQPSRRGTEQPARYQSIMRLALAEVDV